MNVEELLAEVTTAPVVKRAITNRSVLNEAYAYGSAFSRGMRIDLSGLTILLISGTASINDEGKTVHVGDLRAQTRRTFDNITALLASEGATWHDIVRTTCYLRDIERDYRLSTRSGARSTRSGNSILCRLRPASRRFSAARTCWLRLKRSPCSAANRPRSNKWSNK